MTYNEWLIALAEHEPQRHQVIIRDKHLLAEAAFKSGREFGKNSEGMAFTRSLVFLDELAHQEKPAGEIVQDLRREIGKLLG